MKTKPAHLFAALLILATSNRAASFGAALSVARVSNAPAETVAAARIPHPVEFRDVPGRGLLVRAWINSAGPYNFAIDTGAGATLLSSRVASEAQVGNKGSRATSIAGLSGAPTYARLVSVQSLAIGDPDNYLPAKGEVMVT